MSETKTLKTSASQLAATKKWATKNREKRVAYLREYYAANKAALNQKKRESRARKKAERDRLRLQQLEEEVKLAREAEIADLRARLTMLESTE